MRPASRPLPARRAATFGLAAVLAALTLGLTASRATSPEGPFLITTGTFREKAAAQAHARTRGGWVLRTDLYRGLTPGYFAVVRGPFDRRADAEAALLRLLPGQPDAFVRAAGAPVLPPALGDPALLAALLGEVTAEVHENADPVTSCGPDEPHLTVLLGTSQAQRGSRTPAVVGFWVVQRTGEVLPIRPCEG